jgi:hypothetical protein
MRTAMVQSTVLAFVILFAANFPMAAQDGPTQTLQVAFEALARRDWAGLAALVDPTALDSLR